MRAAKPGRLAAPEPPAMPAAGSATYNGRFGATAKTCELGRNQDAGRTVNANNTLARPRRHATSLPISALRQLTGTLRLKPGQLADRHPAHCIRQTVGATANAADPQLRTPVSMDDHRRLDTAPSPATPKRRLPGSIPSAGLDQRHKPNVCRILWRGAAPGSNGRLQLSLA